MSEQPLYRGEPWHTVLYRGASLIRNRNRTPRATAGLGCLVVDAAGPYGGNMHRFLWRF